MLTGLLGFRSDPASAFNAQWGPYPSVRVHYVFDPSFGANGFRAETVWKGEQAWKIQGLAANGEFWNANPAGSNAQWRTVRVWVNETSPFESCDGPLGPAAACATPCPDDGWRCYMTFERTNQYPWYHGTGTPPEESIDAWSVAAHEFGHMHGCDHTDLPGPTSDPNDSTMKSQTTVGTTNIRTIQQDDINCLKTTRPTSVHNMLANGSFEHADPWIGGTANLSWQATVYSGVARACGGAQSGSCYASFSPWFLNEAAIHQNMRIWGYWKTTGGAFGPHRVRAYVRTTGPGQTVKLRALSMAATSEFGVTLAEHTCTTAVNAWRECVTPQFTLPYSNGFEDLRVEVVYTKSPEASGSVHVDNVRFTF